MCGTAAALISTLNASLWGVNVSAAETVALGLLSSIVASTLFLLGLTRMRPKISISPKIVRQVRDGSIAYGIKVINRTRFDLIDVRARFEVLEVIPDVQGPLYRRTDLKLRFSEILILQKYRRNDKDADYAFRFTTVGDLRDSVRVKKPILRFTIIAKHSLSGFSSAYVQRYRISDIEDGYFETGDSMKIYPLDDEDRLRLAELASSAKGDAVQ